MSTLTVLSEDVGILSYLNNNGLYPTALLYTTNELSTRLDFMDEDDIVLVIVHGFTRFTLAEVLSLMHSFKEHLSSGATFKILSDIFFKSPDVHEDGIEFTTYKGDLFFGEYTWYNRKWKPMRSTADEDFKNHEILNGRLKPEKAKNTTYRQDYWNELGEFTNPQTKTQIGELPVHREAYKTSDTKYMEQIIKVELFN